MSLEEKKKSRNCWINKIRVSNDELKKINEMAAKSGLTLSEYVRQSCLYGYVVEQKPLADIELIRELKQLGSNFNQYQHKLNALAKDSPAEVRRVSLKIEHILDVLQGIE